MKNCAAALIVVLSAGFYGVAKVDAADVVTVGQGSSGALTAVIAAQVGGTNDAVIMLLDQVQSLRSEMETMREMVEQQANLIDRLQRDSVDRYTDLDTRISSLYEDGAAAASVVPPVSGTPSTAAGSTAASTAATVSGNTSAPGSTTTPVVNSSVVNAPSASASVQTPVTSLNTTINPQLMTEQQLYQLALDSLLQDEQYERSISEFDQYLSMYPNGRFVTNAHYWKGQSFVNLSRFAEARDSFSIILERYPDGAKVDDASYSLGTVYDRLGNTAQARELLNSVKTKYPNTSAANLADIYLRSMN